VSRNGSVLGGLLRQLHADGCNGREFSTCRPVVVPIEEPSERSHRLEVVYMAWCEECGAADWEVV